MLLFQFEGVAERWLTMDDWAHFREFCGAAGYPEADVEAAVNVALTVLGALNAVHACGLLHLDLKPTNIRVLDDGRIVLLDFGSARDSRVHHRIIVRVS